MKGIKLRTFVIFAIAALFGAALLHTSQRVQHAEDVLRDVEAEVARELETMRMLRAEWEYLNRPERLERLATEFLDLVPPTPDAMPDDLTDEASMLPDSQLNEGQNDEQETQTQPVSYNGGGQ